MAEIIIDTKVINSNIQKINNFLKDKGISWSLVTKVVCGNKSILSKVLDNPSINGVHSIGDSRLSSLKAIKEINPGLTTIYIKPPPTVYAESVVKYADISLNSSIHTIKALSRFAIEQNVVHKIILMIEMGELREGILKENIIEVYKDAFQLKNIDIIGIGTNLGCMYGVEPTNYKLNHLVIYKEILESAFGRDLPILSGGSSITLPLIEKGEVPASLNHLRIGEAVFQGKSPLNNARFGDLDTSAICFKANIIELEKKFNKPDGIIGEASVGDINPDIISEEKIKSHRAIVDFGKIDVDNSELDTLDEGVNFIGTTSDLSVYGLDDSIQALNARKVGDKLSFRPSYMGTVRLMNSKYISKVIL